MQKKYIVRLSDEERDTLKEVVRKLKGTGQKVRRAQVLLNTTPLRKLKNHPAACRWQVGRAEERVEPFWGGHRHGRTDRIGNQTGVDSVPSHL